MNSGQLKELTDRLDAIKESEAGMKDEMYINLRNYLEEQSSLLRQILDELKAQGKMENARIRNAVEKSLTDVLEQTDKPDLPADVFTARAEGDNGISATVTRPKPTSKKGK